MSKSTNFLQNRLEMFKWRPGRVEEESEVRPKKRHMLSPGHVKDSFRTFFKKRPDNKRFYILIYVTMLLMYYLPFFGEGAVSYNYVRTRFAIVLRTHINSRGITCSQKQI